MEQLNIVEFCEGLLGLRLSVAQRTILKSTYGLELEPEELDCCRELSGRTVYHPGHRFPELTVACGAGSGKTGWIAAPILAYEVLCGGHEEALSRGQSATFPIVCPNQDLTRTAFGFVTEYLVNTPLATAFYDDLDVKANEIVVVKQGKKLHVRAMPCTTYGLTSWAIPAAVMDEAAYFRAQGAGALDMKVQQQIRRGFSRQFRSSLLVKISTPRGAVGVLYDDVQRGWGRDDQTDLLVFRAKTVEMWPDVKRERLEQLRRQDPLGYRQDFEAEFLEGVDSAFRPEWIDACVEPGRYERPSQPGGTYWLGVDPSGAGRCSFTMSISHAEGRGADQVILQDVLRGWKKPAKGILDLEAVVKEIADLARSYGVSKAYGDRFAPGWVPQAFARHGIQYAYPQIGDQDGKLKDLDKAAAFANLMPLVSTGHLRMLDKPESVEELKALQRRPTGVIAKPPSGFDDYANSLAISAVLAAQRKKPVLLFGAAGNVTVIGGDSPKGETAPRLRYAQQIGTPRKPGGPAAGAVRGRNPWPRYDDGNLDP